MSKDEITIGISKKFESASAIISTYQQLLQTHPEAIYASQLLSFENLPKP
ncbi:7476_t:CDS:1, partial [Dentiscutata heterogama]